MNNSTQFLLYQLLSSSPLILVYVVGAVLSLIFIRKYPLAALLTLIAVLLLLLNIFGTSFAQSFLMSRRTGAGWSIAEYSRMQSVVSIGGIIVRTLGTALLLAAIFVGRKSKSE